MSLPISFLNFSVVIHKISQLFCRYPLDFSTFLSLSCHLFLVLCNRLDLEHRFDSTWVDVILKLIMPVKTKETKGVRRRVSEPAIDIEKEKVGMF
jgi:hypothetical protein